MTQDHPSNIAVRFHQFLNMAMEWPGGNGPLLEAWPRFVNHWFEIHGEGGLPRDHLAFVAQVAAMPQRIGQTLEESPSIREAYEYTVPTLHALQALLSLPKLNESWGNFVNQIRGQVSANIQALGAAFSIQQIGLTYSDSQITDLLSQN